MSIRAYLEIAAAVVLAIGFGLFVRHERIVGEQKIEASDKAAAAALQKLTEAQTQHAQELATQAAEDASHEQKAVDNYALTHPVGVVRLCPENHSAAGLPQAPAAIGGAANPSTGSPLVSPVPASPDIGPGLSGLVQACSRLAAIDEEWQHR